MGVLAKQGKEMGRLWGRLVNKTAGDTALVTAPGMALFFSLFGHALRHRPTPPRANDARYLSDHSILGVRTELPKDTAARTQRMEWQMVRMIETGRLWGEARHAKWWKQVSILIFDECDQ